MPKPTDCFHPSCLSVIGVLVFDPSYVHWIENTSKALSHCSAQKGFSVFFLGGGMVLCFSGGRLVEYHVASGVR